MSGYLIKVLQRLGYIPTKTPQCSPHQHTLFVLPKKGDRQYINMIDDSPFLDIETTTWVQSAIGSMLYYGRALDNTILPMLNQPGTQ